MTLDTVLAIAAAAVVLPLMIYLFIRWFFPTD